MFSTIKFKLVTAIILAALAGSLCAQDDPKVVEFTVDAMTGAVQRKINVFDRIELQNGKLYHAEPGWLKAQRNGDDWKLSTGSFKVTPWGKTGQLGVPVEQVKTVEFWENMAYTWVQLEIQKNGDLATVRAVLDRFEQEFPTWNPRELQRLEGVVSVQEVRNLFAKRSSDATRVDEVLRKLPELSAAYPDNIEVVKLAAEVHSTLAVEALKGDDLINARRYSDLLRGSAPGSFQMVALDKMFGERAKAFTAEADRQAAAGRPDEALRTIDKAYALAGSDTTIRQKYLELYRKFQLLRIACYDDVVHVDPANARTTLEKMVGRLIFDSLMIKLDSDKNFFPSRLVHKFEEGNLGREVEIGLRPGVLFADGTPLTPQDVVKTIDWLKSHPRNQNSVWARFIEPNPQIQQSASGPVIKVSLKQHPVPKDLFNWPVLSAKELNLNRPETSFPVIGTGPFQRERALNPSDSARLVRNPRFQMANPDAPRLFEIVFPRYTGDGSGADVNDLETGNTHMIFDVTSQQLARLQQANNDFSAQPFETNTVWVLAVNHRNAENPLLQDLIVRRAIYQAIDRQSILKQYFIEIAARVNHKLVTGPFPPHSPAYNLKVVDFKHEPQIAKNTVAAIRADANKGSLLQKPLRLIYPQGQKSIENAMTRIQKDLEAAGFLIDARSLPPHDYLHQVTHERQFDLAYYRIAHENVLFSLQDLFSIDPKESRTKGGRNFMGYEDRDLYNLMVDVTNGKTADEIFAAQQAVHRHIHEKLVVLPLWWLENHVIFTTRLKSRDDKGQERVVVTNPSTIFAQPETWFLEPKRRGR